MRTTFRESCLRIKKKTRAADNYNPNCSIKLGTFKHNVINEAGYLLTKENIVNKCDT